MLPRVSLRISAWTLCHQKGNFMPYEVIMNATGCDGHAVVKVGSMIPVDGGCHATHQEAIDQMTALNIATADERSQRNEEMNAAIDEAIDLLMAAKAAH